MVKFCIGMSALVILPSCVTDLTPQAQRVRQIQPSEDSKCRFLGPVKGAEFFGLTMAGDAASALNKVRNEVASRGGNAFALTNTSSSNDGTLVQADAYDCP